MAEDVQRVESATVLRPEDLLLVRFHFLGLRRQHADNGGSDEDGQQWELVADGSTDIRLVVVEVPTQSIGEEAFFQRVDIPPPKDEPAVTDTEDQLLPLPVTALSGGPTWLVYDVSAQIPIPYTLPGLFLACARARQLVSPIRRRPPDAFPDTLPMLRSALRQSRIFSRIEAPYRLVLSPADGTTWWGYALPKANKAGSRIELWHAWMVQDLSQNPPRPGGKLRAVWATDFPEAMLAVGIGPPDEDGFPSDVPDHSNSPFRMSLDKRDRYELVRLTTDPGSYPNYPKPVEAEQLILSTLGAWLKVKGDWNPPGDLSVTEWRHLMTMGRDHFVRVVYQGFLFPLGHKASLTKISERQIEDVPDSGDGKRAAYLRTRMFVIVREPTRAYGHKGFPFVGVTLKTLITPDIDPPEGSQIDGQKQDAFWVRSGSTDVPFHVVAQDLEGREIELVMPLAFVANNLAMDSSRMADILSDAWPKPVDGGQGNKRRTCLLGGQAVAFARSERPNDTTLETDSIELDARQEAEGAPRFVPLVRTARVDIPAVKQLLGSKQQWSTISYESTFVEKGADGAFGNPAEVFARLVSEGGGGLEAAFRPEQSGGLVTPNFTIEGLSRRLGPVPTVDDLVAGELNPERAFGPDVKLLGGIQLNQIVNQIVFRKGAPDEGWLVPRWVTTVEEQEAVTRYRWHLRKDEADTDTEYRGALGDTGLFKPELGAELEIVSEVRRPLDGSPGSFRSSGRITSFHVVLSSEGADLVDLSFESITFDTRSGQKTDVSVVVRGITFLGPLKFVNALAQLIPHTGFSDPPSLKIDGNGAGLGYSLAIPAVGIGVFSLQNLALSAEFYLPFTGLPANLRLAFCSRENPGQVLVTLFGGGVFFAIRIDTTAVQEVELALEFGGGLSLNLGVASGAVTVMGGVYYQKSGTQVTLVAYYRVVGKLTVLGLISIGAEFYLALEYLVDADKLFGIATLKVKVKIAFFSKTVGLAVRRELKGSDPAFRDVMALPNWQDYCRAFGD